MKSAFGKVWQVKNKPKSVHVHKWTIYVGNDVGILL